MGVFMKREAIRDEFRVNALAAWADYQATGLHVTEEEADAWLAKLEAGEDGEPPECRAAHNHS
jgi:predicted transcriptional regulator